MREDTTRDIQEWSPAAVRLLQGVVEYDDERFWGLVREHQSPLESYFAKLGLVLIVDNDDGYAFVRQARPDELGDEASTLPRLLRRRPLTYGATVLSVILRDELRRSDEQVDRSRCTVEINTIYDTWRTFFPDISDGKIIRNHFESALSHVTDVGFVRPLGDSVETIEVRRLIKARLPVDELEQLRDELLREVSRRRESARASHE